MQGATLHNARAFDQSDNDFIIGQSNSRRLKQQWILRQLQLAPHGAWQRPHDLVLRNDLMNFTQQQEFDQPTLGLKGSLMYSETLFSAICVVAPHVAPPATAATVAQAAMLSPGISIQGPSAAAPAAPPNSPPNRRVTPQRPHPTGAFAPVTQYGLTQANRLTSPALVVTFKDSCDVPPYTYEKPPTYAGCPPCSRCSSPAPSFAGLVCACSWTNRKGAQHSLRWKWHMLSATTIAASIPLRTVETLRMSY